MQFRDVLDALLPPGSLWVPESDADFDKFLDGTADDKEATRIVLDSLADLRNAHLTPILDDLEEEYGLIPGPLSETDRRDRLAAAITAGNGDGTAEFMQIQLRKAGFDVYVHINDPPADPALFIFTGGGAICGHEDALFGYEDAFFGPTGGGALVVNGDDSDIDFIVPTDAGYWPSMFFVGGAATRDGSGALTDIVPASVDISRKDEMRAAITKYKPVRAWCGLAINYTSGG